LRVLGMVGADIVAARGDRGLKVMQNE
jgi:hypothetical protein